jgi:O-antigen ligase
MIKELANCHNLKEIYQTFPQSWEEKTALIMLRICVFLPLLMLPMFYIFPGDTIAISNMYAVLINIAGNLILIFVIIQLTGRFITRKQSLAMSATKIALRKPWLCALFLMLLWAFISSVVSNNFRIAIWGNDYFHEGFFAYCYYAAAFYSATLLQDKRKSFILKQFIWVSLFICIVFLAKYYKIGLVNNYIFAQGFAYFNATNVLGYYLSMSTLILAGLIASRRGKRPVIYSLILAFEIYTLIMNNTFGSFIAVIIALIITIPMIWIYQGHFSFRLFVPALVFVLTCTIYYFISYSLKDSNLIGLNFRELFGDMTRIVEGASDAGRAGSSRYAIWIRTIKMIPIKYLFGYGPEQTYEAYMAAGINHTRPHNEILQYALFLGIPAAVLYIVSLIWLFIGQVKKLRELYRITVLSSFAVIGYFISSMFGNTTPWTTVLFYIFLAFSSDQATKTMISAPN